MLSPIIKSEFDHLVILLLRSDPDYINSKTRSKPTILCVFARPRSSIFLGSIHFQPFFQVFAISSGNK
ncbi:hypothetical protein LWI28_007692 [Acer negundo]|uniref:Uncharacterized protein n=1 Tax=Acer negundo TaxID=4023 RepID=A0AAD5ILP1_ACENE|nr:hypothetical protein LWI28_007692 [Acer negundo]